ncbi:MAG: ABC transporter permease, partial [Gammaproteobacteria bacterium]
MTFNQKFNAFRTIVTKEYLRFIRIWIQTVLPPAMTTALYFVIFGNLIGSQIADIDGHSYMDYIVPGLILMAV